MKQRNALLPPRLLPELRVRSRGYLPHWELEGATYSVTFRLDDSLPAEVLRALRMGPMEFGLWSRRRPEDYHETTPESLKQD